MRAMYEYEAFISYKHRVLDTAIAEKVQTLLENYRPPKQIRESGKRKIGKIFRDRTELTASGDLSQKLKNALLDSRFLIVILSEETKESKWCQEEIRLFKEAHDGKIDHILPVLVSGEPEDSIPPILRFETKILENGEAVTEAVEPLCCDVRGQSVKGSMKKLKTEYLRLASDLLDCDYDELYQRHRRRARRQKVMTAAAGLCVLGILGVVGSIGYHANQKYRKNLENSYLTKGSQQLESNLQQSLLYYSSALELNPESQAAETGAAMLLQKYQWLNKTGTAEAASIPAFHFGTYEEDRWSNLPVPDKINPFCRTDSVIDQTAATVMLGENKAAVSNGGYLYLYEFETDGTAILAAEFDLADVFCKRPENALDTWNEMWASETMLAVTNESSVAIFDISNWEYPAFVKLHTDYGYGLNEVAFDEENGNYALVYGNDYGITLYNGGGYTKVFDGNGECLFETPENAFMAPEGAAFDSSGEQLLIWGSGHLQVWNVGTGEQAAAAMELPKITDAAWTEGGEIAVLDDSGNADLYQMYAFGRSETAAAESKKETEVDIRQTERVLFDKYVLKHNYSRIWLENREGEVLTEIGEYNVNRMYAEEQSETAYVWHNNADTVLEVKIDEKDGTASFVKLNLHGLSIVDLQPVSNGVLVYAGNNLALLYPAGSSEPLYEMRFSRRGNVQESAVSDAGLLAVLLRTTLFEDEESYHFTDIYTVELWDLNTGICVARPEADSPEKIKNLQLSDDGYFSYEKAGVNLIYRVTPDPADKETLEFLKTVCCYELENKETVVSKKPEFSDTVSGTWGQMLLPESKDSGEKTALSAAEQYLNELQEILEKEGKDSWIQRFNEIWEELSEERMNLEYMLDLFRNYVQTARRYELMDALAPGFEIVTEALITEGSQDINARSAFYLISSPVMLQSDCYDEQMIDFWLRMSEAMEQNLLQIGIMEIYENRLNAELLLKQGLKSFLLACGDGADTSEAVELLMDDNNIGLNILYYLVQENPEQAVLSVKRMINAYQDVYEKEYMSELEYTLRLAMWNFHMFEQRGVIKSEILNEFVMQLPIDIGMRISKLTPQNFEAGLEQNDVIVAVEGQPVYNEYHFAKLQKEYPNAVLTIKRGEKYFTTEKIEKWGAYSKFYAR